MPIQNVEKTVNQIKYHSIFKRQLLYELITGLSSIVDYISQEEVRLNIWEGYM